MLKIYSTFSKDIILDKNNKYLSTVKGGPAFYIENFLKKQRIKYKLYTNNTIDVEIKITDKGEVGKTKSRIKESKIKNLKNNDLIIISTIGKEWILEKRHVVKAKIFIDIQGYARTAKNQIELLEYLPENTVFCIKGTESEIKKLPKKILKNQKKKCLIITKGEGGSVIYFNNKKYILKTKKIKPPNTIGAGDIFFIAFIIKLIETNNVIKSGDSATKEAEKFLLIKKQKI